MTDRDPDCKECGKPISHANIRHDSPLCEECLLAILETMPMTERSAHRYRFQLWQDGIEVASVDSPDLASAQREIMHYAMMYAQDGPCEIRGRDMSGFRETFKANTVGEKLDHKEG